MKKYIKTKPKIRFVEVEGLYSNVLFESYIEDLHKPMYHKYLDIIIRTGIPRRNIKTLICVMSERTYIPSEKDDFGNIIRFGEHTHIPYWETINFEDE